jgi:hypothetical protein
MKKENAIKKKSSKTNKPGVCENKMTFEECELAVLRQAVDENEKLKGKSIVQSEEIQNILKIVEEFIINKKLVCYGGTAINNILPKYAQFYDKEIEIPDYDFFSNDALNHAKELADIYFKAGYNDVEAKAGAHQGTFKVFVNFIPIADITYLAKPIYDSIQKDAILRAGIRYAPPNYLRMAMFLELSRPKGDVSRWEKVLKRLTLLNKYYPLKTEKCNTIDFQRKMEESGKAYDDSEKIYMITRDSLINQGVIFFGGYATTLYSKYMPKSVAHKLQKVPDFDVLTEDIDKCSIIVKEQLTNDGFDKVKIVSHDPIGEIIPRRVEILIDKETIASIYEPIACHSYNKLNLFGNEVNVATIDTILSFYLGFLYAKMEGYVEDRLLCMAQFLFDVQQKNRLKQKGMLKRFTIDCVGVQHTLEDMRAEKAQKHTELKNKRGTDEYDMWFLKYVPAEIKQKKEAEKVKKQVTRKKRDTEKNITQKKKPLLGFLF